MPLKAAHISSEVDSPWTSCRTITSSLRKALAKTSKPTQHKFFNYSIGGSDFGNFILAKRIFQYQPNQIVFYDHLPHPLKLLEALSLFYKKDLPSLYFYIYGDFTISTLQWSQSAPFIKKASFICASDKQTTLVKQFIKNQNSVKKVPFCLDNSTFFWSPSARRSFRRKHNIGDKQRIIFYSGRISPEKNVLYLTYCLSKIIKDNPHYHFFIAGGFDDLGASKFGTPINEGLCKFQWNQYIQTLPHNIRSNIHYLGSLNSKDLHQAYCGADLFTSISAYHDEDFGMAPLEALYCGLPTILTDWGGYSSFQQPGDPSVNLIPVKLNKYGYSINENKLIHSIKRTLKDEDNYRQRSARSHFFHKIFSINSIAQQLKSVLNEKQQFFNGFSSFFYTYTEKFKEFEKFGPPRAPFKGGPSHQGLYNKIYKHYR